MCEGIRFGLIISILLPILVHSQDRLPIIDMHMHARTSMLRDDNGNPMPRECQPRPCEGLPALAREDDDVLRLTLEAMDEYNIVLGFLGDRPARVRHWLEAAPDRFIGAVGFNPDLDPAKLREEYRSGIYGGVGELAPVYRGISINDPLLEPYFAIAEEYDLPVLIHISGMGAPTETFRIRTGHPELLEEVLRRHPNVRVYLENASFPFFEEAISIMYMFPQVYADISTISWIVPRAIFYDHLEQLMKSGLGNRLMFGSDQMSWPGVIGDAIESIESAPFLTEEQKRAIFYDNAARFLRLSDEEIAAHHDR